MEGTGAEGIWTTCLAIFHDSLLEDAETQARISRAVLNLIAEAPRKRQEIDDVVDGFEIVQHPRRFGEHFIDVLEHTDAIAWHDHSWTITDLGRTMLAGMDAE